VYHPRVESKLLGALRMPIVKKPAKTIFSPFLAIYPAGSIADSLDDSRVEPFFRLRRCH
jgi:hypothetical protein